MNDILLKIQTFFLEENISKAKKRYLFLVAFVLIAIVEYISLIVADIPPEHEKAILPLTIMTALFAGVMIVYIPRLIGLFGMKNLYFSAVAMTILSSIYAYSVNPDAFSPVKGAIGFITTLLPLMLIMWLAIFLSKTKNTPNKPSELTRYNA